MKLTQVIETAPNPPLDHPDVIRLEELRAEMRLLVKSILLLRSHLVSKADSAGYWVNVMPSEKYDSFRKTLRGAGQTVSYSN